MATSSRSERYRPDMVLIDGRHMLFRGADVGSQLTTEMDGMEVPVGGVYGFLNMCLKLKRRYQGALSVAWEGTDNFRYKLYPEYKRKPAPKSEGEAERNAEFMDGLQFQEHVLKGILCHLGIHQFSGEGGEADDVLGTITARLLVSDTERRIAVYTGDSDLRQLVNDRLYVVAPGRKGADKVYDPEAVMERHGVAPAYIPLQKALAGDSSDNIPGIPGVGDKTAAKLIDAYKTLEAIMEAAHDPDAWASTERYRKLVLTHQDRLPLYLRLTTIRRDIKLERLEVDFNPMKARKLMSRLKFKRMLEAGPFADLTRLRK